MSLGAPGSVLSTPPIADRTLLLWLRADLGIAGATNGAKFANWIDQAKGLTYTQSTSGNQFVWNASDATYNGLPSVTSVAAAFMSNTSFTATSIPFTYYAVANSTSLATQQVLQHNSSVSFALSSSQYYIYNGVTQVFSANTTTGAHAICGVLASSSSAQLYFDNSQSVSGTGNPGSANGLGTTNNIGFTGTLGWIGNFAEQLCYAGAHTAAQRALVFAYFAARYGQAWS